MSPSGPAALILGGAVIAVTAMGFRLLTQDLALERQESRQRLESDADAAVALIDRAISQTAQSMLAPDWQPATPGAILIRATQQTLLTNPPSALLFSPHVPGAHPSATAHFAAAEQDEYAHNDLAKAAAAYTRLRSSADPDIRSNALVRLARVQLKAHQVTEALETYQQLTHGTEYFEGAPAKLLARLARAELLASKTEALQLGKLLDNPPVPISRDVFLYYSGRAKHLTHDAWQPDPERLALAEAVHNIWPKTEGAGRTFIGSYTILHHRQNDSITLFAASLEYARTHWVSKPAIQLNKTGEVTRYPAASSLPWPISLNNPQAFSLFSGRRRLLALATLIIPCMLLLTGYLSWRAVSRERAATAMQAEFVAAVSHEFRTPLTSLRQFTGMLLERDKLNEDQRRTCYEAQSRSTERLSRLVESLLDFRRMEAGARPFHLDSIDADTVISKLSADFERESGARLTVKTPGPCPIYADPDAITLALWNLLDNAVKYAGSPIGLELQSHPASLKIIVTDHGPGIPASEQRKIFDKFYRGAEALKNGIKGTGIGLAMVRHVAAAHHGAVEVQSSPGQGTSFTLILPKT